MRESGYYWCKHSEQWNVFKWREDGVNSAWSYFGTPVEFEDSDFLQINETRIKNPDEK